MPSPAHHKTGHGRTSESKPCGRQRGRGRRARCGGRTAEVAKSASREEVVVLLSGAAACRRLLRACWQLLYYR